MRAMIKGAVGVVVRFAQRIEARRAARLYALYDACEIPILLADSGLAIVDSDLLERLVRRRAIIRQHIVEVGLAHEFIVRLNRPLLIDKEGKVSR